MNRLKNKFNHEDFKITMVDLFIYYRMIIFKRLIIDCGVFLLALSLMFIAIFLFPYSEINNWISLAIIILIFLQISYWLIRVSKINKVINLLIQPRIKNENEIDLVMNLFYVLSMTLFQKNITKQGLKLWKDKLKDYDKNNWTTSFSCNKIWKNQLLVYVLSSKKPKDFKLFLLLNWIIVFMFVLIFFLPLSIEIIFSKTDKFKIKNNKIVNQNFQTINIMFWTFVSENLDQI